MLVKGRVGTGVTVNGFRCGGAVSVVVPGCAALEVAVFSRGLVFSRMGVGKRASWYWCYG